MSELLNLPRASRRLGVTAKWLRNQADCGIVPCLRAGTRYLFNVAAVQEALAAEAAKRPVITGHGPQGVDRAQ
jgi:hypothetical protein